MILLMIISLYTTRIILSVLGIVDYGVYNVVGGLVAMFAIVSRSLSTACSRFLNVEMGRGTKNRLNIVFSTTLTVQIILALVVVVLVEIIGLWFLNNKLTIPDDRMEAANWVFQFSVLTFCLNLVSIPYNALIIAHEKMKAFAYISIYEGFAKLVISFLITLSSYDKLVIYAILMFVVQLSIRLIYTVYCKRNFPESRYKFIFEKKLIKEIFVFSGWNFLGASAVVIKSQGANILINIFFGPSINAARSVSSQINQVLTNLVNSFMIAVKPQITKSYAAGDIDYMAKLVNYSARFSYFLVFLCAIPIVLNIDFILYLWLKNVPTKTGILTILTIVLMLSELLSSPLITTQLASGKMRNYQL